MIYGAVKALAGTLSICLLFSGTFSYARCSVDVVIVNGRVELHLAKASFGCSLFIRNRNSRWVNRAM